ncbi:MAG: HAMP domain-containing histidine kinase [Oscillospiraceae bacterium]|nr:HAMP domain-containing histidine kinase [Oscillospiraceae bacterium]
MKRYIGLYILLVAAILVGFIMNAKLLEVPVSQEVDPLAVNDIVKIVEESWPDLLQMDSSAFLYPACAIDNEGRIMWATDSTIADNMQTAIRWGYTIMDITVDSTVVGKVLIETTPHDLGERLQRQMANQATAAIILVCVVSLLFLLLLHHVMIRPFQKLESFAHKISTGRFDEPLPMEKNNVFGLFTQSFDVMRASLLEARHKQTEAEQAKKELTVSLSHDIKTPLTSIKLIVELLLAGNPAPPTYDKLKTLEAKADQISRLINDMMHSALEELGELKVNLTSESSEVLKNIFADADYQGLVKIGSIPQCMIDLDPLRMEQVIGNIITNSYKYAGTDIDVEMKIENGYLTIHVNDYGTGVEAEEIELICNKFYRGENAKASQKDGEGLGLYVSRQLMRKMDGELEVYNRKNGFTVTLMLRLSQ